MDIKVLEKIKHSLFETLEQFSKRGDMVSNIKPLHDITSTLKNICKIMELEEGYSEGGYEMGGSYRGSSYRGGMDDGYSERRRDRMGRYSRDGRVYNGYSQHGDIVEELHELMQEASTDEERRAIKKCIEQMQ